MTNAGARANHIKAQEIALEIARRRSEGQTYSEVASALGISATACKQRLWRYRQYVENKEEQ